MKLILDTHTLLWWAGADPQLSTKAKKLLANPAHELLVSPATAWEIATKHRLGKLPGVPAVLMQDMPGWFAKVGLLELPITVAHAALSGTLSGAHRDPFDRMLAAQSLLEQIPIVGCDKALLQFGVTLIW